MTTETTQTPAAPAPQKFLTTEQALASVNALGLAVKEQSGYYRVDAPGGRLYISKGKTVRRVDLSGFEFGLGRFTTSAPEGISGGVKQQLKMEETAEATLQNLDAVLTHLASLPAIVKPVKAPKAPKAAKDSGTTTGEKAAAPKTAQELADQAALIRKVAGEMGVPVSPNAPIAQAAEASEG